MTVLGEPHRPADDDLLGGQDMAERGPYLFLGQTGGLKDVVPRGLAGMLGELLEAMRVPVDESGVEDRAGRLVLRLQQHAVEGLNSAWSPPSLICRNWSASRVPPPRTPEGRWGS